MRLRNKTAVITGAGQGIGRSCALQFAREGAQVVIADIQARHGQSVVDEIVASGGEAFFVETDVGQRSDNERMIDACVDRYGKLDVLLCNAGVILSRLLPESSDEEIDRLWDINVRALIFASRYTIPIMLDQPNGGVILYTASKTGLVAQKDSPVYCASKGAAIMLAKALALDYATKGIRVNALCPGIIDTPMLKSIADSAPDPIEAWAMYKAAQPMGRLGTPEECADAAVWLASDEASFITGLALPIDGGFTAM